MKHLRLTMAVLAVPVLTFSTAYAASTGSSSAYGVSASLNVAPLLGSPISVTAGPLPSASGSAPGPYQSTNQVASANVLLGLLITGSVHTGVLTVNAASNIPNTLGSSADATVNNTKAVLASLFGLTADVIGSKASTGGACGAPTATGSTTLVGAKLNGVTLDANPAPNTVVLNFGGVKVILNEQIEASNGPGEISLTVNAIHVELMNAALGLGLVSGDVIISQSKAALQCSPASADLVVQKTSTPADVHIGTQLTYKIYVSNAGPDLATGVVITDALPGGAVFVSSNATQGSCQGTKTVICDLGAVPVGTLVTIDIVATARSSDLQNTAVGKATESDPDPSNNTSTTSPHFLVH